MSFRPFMLSIPCLVVPKGRPRFTKAGHAYTPEKTRTFETLIKFHWKRFNLAMLPKCPTSVEMICFIPRPKSVSKKVLIPITKPDLDNAAKAVLDALNGVAWEDDNQVSDLRVMKRYTDSVPMIIMKLKPDTEAA